MMVLYDVLPSSEMITKVHRSQDSVYTERNINYKISCMPKNVF